VSVTGEGERGRELDIMPPPTYGEGGLVFDRERDVSMERGRLVEEVGGGRERGMSVEREGLRGSWEREAEGEGDEFDELIVGGKEPAGGARAMGLEGRRWE